MLIDLLQKLYATVCADNDVVDKTEEIEWSNRRVAPNLHGPQMLHIICFIVRMKYMTW